MLSRSLLNMSLNELTAKMMKAEMLGDEEKAAELRQRISELRSQGSTDANTHLPRRSNDRSSHNSRQRHHQRIASSNSELNALNAKILKAELMGDMERVAELRTQLKEIQEGSYEKADEEDPDLNFEAETARREALAKRTKCIQLAKKINEDQLSLTQMVGF